mmetsp:Transcript_28857/g.52205  ORF Transcript_28857/g.52205 Transcript_28857/m.52205 type:complete len:720 (+) Transcript_28857:272-2431(+)|eukprot:CAMPEP_0202499144 /NCGR_PEP_ID=MMETSP1361-20130828/28789_1 /ASSEMBLY_ACC=CAM_ASM_000849 /TAXON_ID=210615 /ORGANISM="Staurosira complex sp., Strain CCMP2646" /LENGTH=719 /DNA_ID=CAMNT_0049131251 /DNA_START=247 /DNA_END=2406 /DNA_ORIENTATION=+
MVAVAVSPSTVGSPASDASPPPSSTSSSLFHSVHKLAHVESDWESVRISPAGQEEEIYQLMEDLAKDIFSDSVSESEHPKWTVDSSGKDVKISFNSSEDKVWTIARKEIEAYRERICKLTKLNFDEIDPVKHILELFMGKSKPLMQLMMSSLEVSYEKAAHFLGTFCIQKAYRVSVAELYDDIDDGRLNTSDLLPRNEYVEMWKKIADSPDGETTGRNKKYFWQKFQDRMNETFNEINVLMMGSLIVSLDDDKKKASIGKGKNMQGLKQHVLSDRRKGIVGHTAVSPATLLTLGVVWEMEGQSAYECYVKLVKEIFGEKPTLDQVTFCSDRGYWILKVLKYLLKHGAHVHGTVRRQDWYGLTYGPPLKEGDPRLNIDKNGPSALYVATTEISDRDVTANGYRNGTGGVALTISSLIHGCQWECVVNDSICVGNKIPLVVHPDRRRGLLYRPFGSNDAFWNKTKHGSDTKTQACQSVSVPLPVDTPGAKAYDRMQMNVFADIHKGAQMFLANKDLAKYGDIEHFRNAASHRMTFRACLIEISKIFLSIANGNGANTESATIVSPQQSQAIPRVSKPAPIRRSTEDVLLPAARTGRSPQKNKLKRLMNPSTADEQVASKRLKSCIGRPWFRVCATTGKSRGAGAEGACIVCNKRTNWYCRGCGNRCCAHRSPPEGPEFYRDISSGGGSNDPSKYITARRTCLMACHPSYLTSGWSVESNEL